MAKLRDAKGRGEELGESGYERLFGVHELGVLLSKCQAAVISSGNELENILAEKIRSRGISTEGIAVGDINKDKRIFKKAKINSKGKLHDLGVDVIIERDGKIKLIELKDGDVFDVKKVAGEIESLELAKKKLIEENKIPEKNISIHFCSFNAKDHQQIERGAKGLLPKGSAMTGRELCEELGIDYDEIIRERKREQPENLDYFLTELIKIPEIRERLSEIMKNVEKKGRQKSLEKFK
jgi:hypothetical protein